MNPQELHALMLGHGESRRGDLCRHLVWPSPDMPENLGMDDRNGMRTIPMEIVAFFMVRSASIMSLLPADRARMFGDMVEEVHVKLNNLLKFDTAEKRLVNSALKARICDPVGGELDYYLTHNWPNTPNFEALNIGPTPDINPDTIF